MLIEIIFNCTKCDTTQLIELEFGETQAECYKCHHVNIIRLREVGDSI